jgi:hypothetical protein
LRRTILLAVLAAVALGACGETKGGAGTGAGSLPLDARSPLEPQGKRMRVLVQFHRPSLSDVMKTQSYSPSRQRAYVASLRDEAVATQSSLRAKGIKLGRPVLYARVWNGFSATIAARDLPKLRALGLRSEPVRRFFGATAAATASVTTPEKAPGSLTPGGGRSGKVAVALLDTGVDRRTPGLEGRIERGRDAVGHDADPSPGGAAERHGSEIAAVLAGSLGGFGGRILSVRVAGLQRDAQTGGRLEYGTTDALIEGLERAVDPNGDGAVDDRAPVALVGVSSPYAGFGDSPEAQSVAGATVLGTLVVAPAGNEGRRVGMLGTIGSPGAAPDALTVGALEGGGAPALPTIRLGLATEDGRALADGALLGGSAKALRAPVTGLVGASQQAPKARGRSLGGSSLDYFSVDAKPRARGRVVVVPARAGGARPPALATRAAAAAQAGAAALVVCEPDASRPLPALPDGAAGLPVIGLRGDAAERALDLTDGGDGGLAFISEPKQGTDQRPLAPGASSSQGPTYALAPKPDVADVGTATVEGGRPGTTEFVAGTSVAAARVAGIAARLRAGRPAAKPAEIAARLVETATFRGPAGAAGGGRPDLARASVATLVAEPALVAFPRQEAHAAFAAQATVRVRNLGSTAATITPRATLPGARLTLAPEKLEVAAHAEAELSVSASAAGSGRPPGQLAGTLTLGGAKLPLALPVGPAPPAPLSVLRLVTRGSKTTGVRFSAGAATPAAGGLAVQPVGDLRLQILDAAGKAVRDLTPQGGARDLLPGEYAYTLTRAAQSSLGKGTYRFRATAHGPAGGAATVRTSPSFSAR